MNKVYLVGFMGSGKTTLGKKLARRLGYSFYDTDKAFEHRYKTSIDLFFTKYGENLFRELEYKLLLETFSLENTVIATGGGTPCFFDSMELINRLGISVYIELTPEAIFDRLIKAKKRRPLLIHKTADEIKTFIETTLGEREQFYRLAKITFNGISPKADLLIRQLGDEGLLF